MSGMTVAESIAFVIFVVMTVAFFVWVAYLAFVVVFAASIVYLWRRSEAADRLANEAASAWRDGLRPQRGPGFPGSRVAHPDARPGQTLDEPDLFSELGL